MMKSGLFLLLLPLIAADTSFDQPFSDSFAKLNHAPCVSLFHRDGRSGCGTEDHSNQVGQLQYFDGSLPNKNDPYVIVMEDYDLTIDNINTLMAAAGGLLKGVLVLNSTNADTSDQVFMSPDSTMPQGYGTPSANLNYGYNSYAWNAKGQGIFLKDLFGIPMAYVIDADVSSSLRQEAMDESVESAIVADFNYYMGPEGTTSKDCLAWKDAASNEWNPKCLPLGGSSVWAGAGSPYNAQNNGRELASSKNIVMIAANMDSTSLFHDVSPGANTAASNILTILMAAKLIGANLDDATLDGLSKRILFTLFQGESYGFVGSRRFLKDVAYPGFTCNSNPVRSVSRLGDQSDWACLDPLRPNLLFSSLGTISGMLSVDQVGRAVADGLLYVHTDKQNDKYGAFLANILKASGTNTYSVAASSVERGQNGYPYPPTPLTSLRSLSQGAVGGAVLTGYDYTYSNKPPYHSHLDMASLYQVNYKEIAAAATIVARTAVAAAYDNGYYDYATASAYALNIIPELSYQDDDFVKLADCLFYNGQCQFLQKYATVELSNQRVHTGLSWLNVNSPLGNPQPNYYVGVYNGNYGQPFVTVGDNAYGAYNGTDYGSKSSDTFASQPTLLESAIHGLFNDYLGRGSLTQDGATPNLVSCSKISDCSGIDYCSAYSDSATCSGGGYCVCSRSQYHVAVDEALVPAKNKPTGYFEVDENDEGYSAMYTEPYWSSTVGVRLYRDVGPLPGIFTLAAGVACFMVSLFAAFVLKIGLKKEKLY